MKTRYETYPIFEANQVLTNAHLNEMFNYLDEQEHLTRNSLIGIGIACGLEITFQQSPKPVIRLSRGCGVTSTGYLIHEPDDVDLIRYREYKLPDNEEYLLFKDKGTDPQEQYLLWELFPAGEPNTTPIETPVNFLNDKAVLLFLELKNEALRTCSPSECDDKGRKVTPTLRRLLIKDDDLKKIIAEVNKMDPGITFADLEAALTTRLNLPDLRLPRYDVPNTGSVTSNDVLAAFHAVFHTSKLVSKTEEALKAAYDAFKPVVQQTNSSNPFTGFSAKFGFLEKVPTKTEQVRFLPYYYDFFDDLLKAYHEFRWKGVALLCDCCPQENLFPRHLMLGLLRPSAKTHPSVYRHRFIPSPAVGGCGNRTKEVVQLFQRLVEMINRFTNKPLLPAISPTIKPSTKIRITPDMSGGEMLSDKAIAYYYLMGGTPALYQLWNFEKTIRDRANLNLSYRSDEYDPPAPAFVTDPLRYNLDPYNFLRIEGHVGEDVREVLKTLLALKDRFRLPIEIIALRSGAFDEDVTVDLSKEQCRFQDLEALYDTLREELLNTLCEGAMYFYDIDMPKSNLPVANNGVPKLALLNDCAPNFRYKKDTVGAWYETYLDTIQPMAYIDVDQNNIDQNQVLMVYCILFTRATPPEEKYYAHVVSVYYLSKLAEILPSDLSKLRYSDFENKYQDLIGLIRFFRSDATKNISDDLQKFIPQEDLIDHCDEVLFSCKLKPIKAVYEEYQRRITVIKKKQFFSFFLQKHPGIQHKAGVPTGGTFIIVYHEDPTPMKLKLESGLDDSETIMPGYGLAKIDRKALSDAISRISADPKLVENPHIRDVIGIMTGQIPDVSIVHPSAAGGDADKIIKAAVDELADGTVIADFFLPYLCCSDCAPIQYVLPTPPLGLLVELGCTAPSGIAEATLTPQGGMQPFTYQLDNQPFEQLTGKLLLSAGSHTIIIRDSAGSESASQSIRVPDSLTIGTEKYIDDVASGTYKVSFTVSGGTAPYTSDSGTIDGNNYTSDPVKSEMAIKVKITDSKKCSLGSKEFKHTVCTLPCKGMALRCGFRFWIPEPNRELKRMFKSYGAKVAAFRFEYPEGGSVDLSREVEKIIQADVNELNEKFNTLVPSMLNDINKLIADKIGSDDCLRLEYQKLPSDPVGTLWIENFECLDFEFHIHSEFQQPEFQDTLEMIYTPKGTSIANLETNLPPFNCVRINKCDPNQPTEDLCKQVDLQLKIIKKLEGNEKLSLNAIPSGDDQPTAYLWEVLDGVPAMSNKANATFTFRQKDPRFKMIWLAAYTAKGCRVIKTDLIELTPD